MRNFDAEIEIVNRASGCSTVKDPFFSVVVPVYNKRPHVRRAINSVLNQTFDDYELLIVDDASTDGSLEEVQRLDDCRIRFLHRDRPGPGGYAARNLGIQEARADWIAFLDADDEWLAHHLENMRQLHQQFPNVRMLGAGWETTEGDQRTVDPYSMRYARAGRHTIDFYTFLERDLSCGKPFCTLTVCVHKEVILEAGGFPEGNAMRGGDIDTWFRIMLMHGRCAWSPHIGAVYYRNAINMVSRKSTLETPSISKSIASALSRPDLSLKNKYLLMKNSNLNCHSTIKLAMRSGALSAIHLKNYYFLASPVKYVAFQALMIWQTLVRYVRRSRPASP